MTLFNKLSDFDMQILIYLSHVIVRDLVSAKINNQIYDNIIIPDELIDFLKKFKIDLQNTTTETKNSNAINLENNINSLNTPKETNNSICSYMPSVYSNFSGENNSREEHLQH